MHMKITTIGEILVDMTQTHIENGIPHFAANPGGAPANVAVAASKLGVESAFIGCVGDDLYGELLRKTLEENGVDVTGLQVTPKANTTLAIVMVDPGGERTFSFYRKPGADTMIDAAQAIRELTTYDPNYRAALWEHEDAAVLQMRAVLPLCDIVKISDEETMLLCGVRDPEAALEQLMNLGIRLAVVTLGRHGALWRCGNMSGLVPGFSVQVADTNGAGDTFFGAFLSRIACRGGLDGLTEDELNGFVRFANKAASITTSRRGAIPAMPALKEVKDALD